MSNTPAERHPVINQAPQPRFEGKYFINMSGASKILEAPGNNWKEALHNLGQYNGSPSDIKVGAQLDKDITWLNGSVSVASTWIDDIRDEGDIHGYDTAYVQFRSGTYQKEGTMVLFPAMDMTDVDFI